MPQPVQVDRRKSVVDVVEHTLQGVRVAELEQAGYRKSCNKGPTAAARSALAKARRRSST